MLIKFADFTKLRTMLISQKPGIKYKMTLRKLVNLKKMIFSKGPYKVDREQKSFNTNIVGGEMTQKMSL